MFERIQLDAKLAAEYGLDAADLSRLDSIVAITGPNGAGKTRLLQLLADQLQADRSEFERHAAVSNPDHPEHKSAACNIGCDTSGEPDSQRAHYLAAMKRFASRYRVRAGWREFMRSSRWPRVVYLHSGRERRKHQRDRFDSNEDVQNKDLRAFPQDTLNELAQARVFAQLSDWAEANADLRARADAFAATIRALIGAELGVHTERTTMVATLDGRRVDRDALSEGQRVLLRWAQIIHEEVADIRDAVLLIDEPELHLHPDALIEAMERLVELGPAQIWVATHSIPLLAWIGAKRIYYMQRGCSSWAGNQIDHVLAGLLGATDGTSRLRTFLSDAGSLAFHQFAAECLMPPGVASLREADRQAQRFVTRISQLLADPDRDVRVLEYGAGFGRLIEALAAAPAEHRGRLHYYAYNHPRHTNPVDENACRGHLAALEGPRATGSYSNDIREYRLDGADKMDAVILCNVLHEIPPHTWPELMSTLRACLRSDGHLLILEDQSMSVGELPHDAGYIVLDEIELCELFGVARGSVVYADDGRVSLAEIPAEYLEACKPERVTRALEQVQQRALEQIRALRDAGSAPATPDHRRGRAHAYYAMLHTNATLARS